jgi:hypothetical protein
MDSIVQRLLNDASSESTPGFRQNVEEFHQFSLTEKSNFRQLFKKPIAIEWLDEGKAKVRVPACNPIEDIKAPAHTLSVNLCFMLLSCETSSGSLSSQVMHTLQLPFVKGDLPAHEFDLPYRELPSGLSVIAVAIRYSLKPGKQLPLNKELQWMPAMIAGGIFDL